MTDLSVSGFEVEKGGSSSDERVQEVNASPAKEEYKKKLAAELFYGSPYDNRVLNFGGSENAVRAAAAETEKDSLRMLYTLNRMSVKRASYTGRHIPQSPERILDAPELLDDYYLNLLDWNAENILAVALGDSVYLWNATTGAITPLMQTTGSGCHVTSISWAPRGEHRMAVGTSDHKVSQKRDPTPL